MFLRDVCEGIWCCQLLVCGGFGGAKGMKGRETPVMDLLSFPGIEMEWPHSCFPNRFAPYLLLPESMRTTPIDGRTG